MAIPDKEYLTTGEAARVLGVSPSTVIRRFDEGRLTGRRNPVTGRRYIAWASVASYLQAHDTAEHGAPAGQYLILAADTDEATPAALQAALDGRPAVRVRLVHRGCEVCGRALRYHPDLLLINVALPDMSGRDVVRCVRHLPGFADLPVVLCVPPGEAVSDHDLQELHAAACLHKPWRLGELRDTLDRLLPPGGPEGRPPAKNRRRWPRIPADWPAELTVHLNNRSTPHDRGSARVRNISRGGALLSDIRLREGKLAAGPFTLHLRLTGDAGEDLSVRCRPVRTEANGDVQVGVEFLDLDPRQADRIVRLGETFRRGAAARAAR